MLTSTKLWPCLSKQLLKTQEKSGELEITYLNGIYICISWYSKTCWSLVKKRWCQQNPRGMSRDSYSFWNLFRQGIAVPSFIIVGYVRQILERGPFLPPPPIREQPRKSSSWIGLKEDNRRCDEDSVWSCGTNIKGKLWPRGYKLNLEEFCEKYDIPKILKDTKTTVCRCSTKQV